MCYKPLSGPVSLQFKFKANLFCDSLCKLVVDFFAWVPRNRCLFAVVVDLVVV